MFKEMADEKLDDGIRLKIVENIVGKGETAV